MAVGTTRGTKARLFRQFSLNAGFAERNSLSHRNLRRIQDEARKGAVGAPTTAATGRTIPVPSAGGPHRWVTCELHD